MHVDPIEDDVVRQLRELRFIAAAQGHHAVVGLNARGDGKLDAVSAADYTGTAVLLQRTLPMP